MGWAILGMPIPSATLRGLRPLVSLRGLRGNLLSDGVRTFTYDAANRLTSVTSGTLTTTFEYDGLPAPVAQAQVGNRMAQTVDGVTTEYVLDVAGGLPEVIVATTGGASTRYVQVQGQILAEYDAGAWGYVLPDTLGSVRQLVDAAGQVSLAQSYDPFGVPHSQHGTQNPQLPFGYTGEQADPSTGLVFLRARYYDPYGGVFVQKDSFLGIPLSPSTMNGFNYANQNPVNLTDRSGYSPHGGDPIALCLELPACRILLGMGGSVVGVTSSPVLVMLAVPTGLLAITYFYCGPTGCAPDPVIPPEPVPEPPAPAPPLRPPLPGVTPMPPFPDTTGTGEDPLSLPAVYQAPQPEPAPQPRPKRPTPPVPVPIPTTCTPDPKRKHISLGRNFDRNYTPLLVLFTHRLNEKLNHEDIYVYAFGDWFSEGLSSVTTAYDFSRAFDEASENAEGIHFNLETLGDPNEYVKKYGSNGEFKGDFEFTAVELYRIKTRPRLCNKAKFYERGSVIVVESMSAWQQICGQ
jgi:RHS repeat-associated protein